MGPGVFYLFLLLALGAPEVFELLVSFNHQCSFVKIIEEETEEEENHERVPVVLDFFLFLKFLNRFWISFWGFAAVLWGLVAFLERTPGIHQP